MLLGDATITLNILTLIVSSCSMVVALYAILHADIVRSRSRPVMRLRPCDSAKVSSGVQPGYWVRIPVSNDRGKITALNVEVLKVSVKINGDVSPSDFFPQRLRWSNAQGASCPSLHAGAYRVFDLGKFVRKTLESEERFLFAGETGDREFSGRADFYEITLLISGDNFDAFEVAFKLLLERDGYPPAIIVE